MFNSVFVASTGGMFLIGYALRLGADNFLIGLLSSVPMCCVLAQLAGAWLVERRISRKRLTIAFSLLQVAGWTAIILIPVLGAGRSGPVRMVMLIGVLSLVTLFAHVAANARASWIGDLVPAAQRGTFFGRLALFGGIIGTLFALAEGGFLDWVKQMGLSAFTVLFAVGMAFGIAATLLFIPQADVPIKQDPKRIPFRAHLREAFANRPLMALMVFAILWSLQNVAMPFYHTYMLRELNMSFFGVGITNAAMILTFLASSPFWGRIVDRYGCRPVIILCAFAFAPIQAVWIPLDSAAKVYAVVLPANLLVGFLVGGMNVALSTLIYKITPSAGRSVQIAVYSVIVVLLAAPMPALGGKLPEWFQRLGFGSDLRHTFYLAGFFTLLAAFSARSIIEDGAQGTRALMANLLRHLLKPSTLPKAHPPPPLDLPAEARGP
jgi:MFS family permease